MGNTNKIAVYRIRQYKAKTLNLLNIMKEKNLSDRVIKRSWLFEVGLLVFEKSDPIQVHRNLLPKETTTVTLE